MKKLFVYFLLLMLIISTFVYIMFFSKYVMPWNKEETIKTTLEWGGLNTIPNNAEIIKIEKRGSIFTRQYIIEFKSSESEIKSWIKKSKRLKDNSRKVIEKREIFDIYPGENDAFGGVVDIEGNHVKIKMSWS